MDERRLVKISKYLAKHLRHRPERIGLTLDPGGWADVGDLIAASARHGFALTRDEIEHVVAANDKRRYELDGNRIRAVQGHSVPVDLGLPVVPPPDLLYHGTVGRFVEAILRDGLLPMERHAVHLSPTARPPGASAPAAANPSSSSSRPRGWPPAGTSSASARTACGWSTRFRRNIFADDPRGVPVRHVPHPVGPRLRPEQVPVGHDLADGVVHVQPVVDHVGDPEFRAVPRLVPPLPAEPTLLLGMPVRA